MIGFHGEGVREMKQRRRFLISTVLALAVFAIAAPVAQAHPFVDHATSATSPQLRALHLRSEGMNQLYGTSQAIRALHLRSQALNQAYGLGVYQGANALRLRSEALNQKYGAGGGTVAASHDSFNWSEGIAGAAGVFATVLVLAGAIAVTRRQRTTALGA